MNAAMPNHSILLILSCEQGHGRKCDQNIITQKHFQDFSEMGVKDFPGTILLGVWGFQRLQGTAYNASLRPASKQTKTSRETKALHTSEKQLRTTSFANYKYNHNNSQFCSSHHLSDFFCLHSCKPQVPTAATDQQ